MNNDHNLVLMADAYKYSHHKLYYPGTTRIYSYLESRGGEFDDTVFFGLQYILKKWLAGQVINRQKLDEADEILPAVFGRDDIYDRSRFEYLLRKHNGRLPVRIRAVAEGSRVDTHQVLMTIENTDPACAWVTNFLETILMQVWYPTTVATLSGHVRDVVSDYFQQTASTAAESGIGFVLNDFGFRGASSVETAAIGGAAHLIHFDGSDTIPANQLIRQYYNSTAIYGRSVPATEHSICTLLGEEGELEVFRHILNTVPTGIVACVSDSYNILRACRDYWGGELRQQILDRDGTLVIRPDSGDPVITLLKVFEILMDRFGYTINDKGYRVLPPQVRVLQGDGINLSSIRAIYGALTLNGISAENLLLGMGGALLQKVDRDTQKFALKCSYAEINGNAVDIRKYPMELDGSGLYQPSFKQSKAGRLKLIRQDGLYKTVGEQDEPTWKDQLITVFENGELVHETDFDEIKARAMQTAIVNQMMQ
ncbi:MAG: nicotinate phosphoribosyltransferase [Chitinophagaceae bacterium]